MEAVSQFGPACRLANHISIGRSGNFVPETSGARLGTDAPLGITCSYPGNFTIDIANVSLVGPNVAPVPLEDFRKYEV